MQTDYEIVSRLLGELGNLDCSTSELAALLAALVEHSPVPIWIFGLDHTIVYNNRSSCRFGSGDNVVGSHLNSFSSQIRAMLEQGLRYCEEQAEVCSKEGWIVSPVIGERYLHFDFLPLLGKMCACLMHDYTDNERAKKAFKASKERAALLANMLELGPVPCGAAYPDGRLLLANPAFCKLTGYSEDELRQLSLFDTLTTSGTFAAEAKALQELERSGMPQRYEKEIARQDGSSVPVEMFIQQITDEEGGVQHLAFYTIDISQRPRLL